MKIKTVGELMEFLKTQPQNKRIIGIKTTGHTTDAGTHVESEYEGVLMIYDLGTRLHFEAEVE